AGSQERSAGKADGPVAGAASSSPTTPAPPPLPQNSQTAQTPQTPQNTATAAAPAVPPGAATEGAAPLGSPVVRSIQFKGTRTLSEETLLYYLGLEVGQPLDEARLNSKIKELWDRNLIDSIEVGREPVAGGVRLTITVQERPILRSVEYEGLKRLSKTDIQDKIATQHIRIREGEPLSLGELQRVKGLIEDLYHEKGYRFAQARYTVQDASNEKRVVFNVDEGDQVRITQIKFEGNSVFGNLRLRWAMKKTKEANLISRFTKKDIYDPAKLQEDLDKVRDLYKSEGYKNVLVADPKIEVRAENPSATNPKDQKRRMFISIPVEEGERWKFGEVSIDGNKVYTDQALLRAFQNRPGAWLRAKVLDDDIKKITDLYHNTGYIFARIEPELVEKPGHVADVSVHINEGDQFKVGRIEFAGNDRTIDKVLRREVRLYEGGLVNIGAVRNSVFKVNQLGYFKLTEEDPVDIDTNSEKKQVSLVFKGKEASRTEVQFGGGWSQTDGLFGQFSLNTKNFLGRGEQLGASVQTGRLRNLYDLSYYVPWFLDKPQSLGFQLYSQKIDYSLLSNAQTDLRNSKGTIITYGRNFGLFNSASVSYNLSRYDDRIQILNSAGQTTTERLFLYNSSIRPTYVYDSRDNPYEPTRGKRVSLSFELAGGPLQGNNDFYRPEANFTLFQPLGSLPTHYVLGLNASAGFLIPYGSKPLSPLEYYFLGGENSIRGHRFRSLIVRDPKTNLPVLAADGSAQGGDKFVQLNTEYHFLFGGPFRVLLFGDIANVYGPGQNIDLSRLRYTAGVELRITVPILGAPLRFIYSKNLNALPKDSFEPFTFSIGTSF
ncbi:MAG: outer membrane protein assembly factor BamA, partial [Acidobacteriota bacterium]|nr:outer membrane protein assembly factor BamA [Acidobacteriota bacterium]